MKLELQLSENKSSDEIYELKSLIAEKNIRGLAVNLLNKRVDNTMGGDYLPIIQLILGSTVVAGGVKGIFDVIKAYIELQKSKITSIDDFEKVKLKSQEIEFTSEGKNGEKIILKLSAFNENERTKFYDIIDKAIS